MSIGVERVNEQGCRCTACDVRPGQREYKPRPAIWRVKASDDTLMDQGGRMELCERHALALFNAIGVMLHFDGLLKIGKGTEATAKAKKLLEDK